ncbi:MAG TPA: A/G-specific adenine glycosylase [Terriglobales bacterium]|nr:A/G-specific adenine glycosylase [Terriglobales bacterium]
MISGLTFNSRQRNAFRKSLLNWYDVNRRDLPWRQTKDPYRIWISEIMLQQTRVGAVLDHYRRFLDRFPDVETLAKAREQSVLAAWSGLGYYRRARNLHAAAKVVSFERGGEFPRTAEGLRELPGVGRYTSAAIASIAFDEPNAVVDGNVERVLSRVTGRVELSERETWTLAEEMLSRERPGDFNQAMMELGATVCLPGEPKCLNCPVIALCKTRGSQPTRKKEQRVSREISLALPRKEGAVWLVQRDKSASLMPGMWELPEISANGRSPEARFKHSILNTDYNVSIYLVEEPGVNGCWIATRRLSRTALTGLARKVLRHFSLI